MGSQNRSKMRFLCVSFDFVFNSSTVCLCSPVIFGRPFLSLTTNQELAEGGENRKRPLMGAGLLLEEKKML